MILQIQAELVIGGFAIMFLLITFIVLFIFLYQKRHYRHLEEKRLLQSRFQSELLQTQLEIQEQTFQNISQEIHDNIGQTLSFIKLNMNTTDHSSPPHAAEKMAESKILISKVIQDLRDISRMLNTDFINETGLNNAIEQQLHILEKAGLFTTSLQVLGQTVKYPLQQELVVFRIVQELLNNIVKHADASRINITVTYEEAKLIIAVKDDGKGFTNTNDNAGQGLRNIATRIELINGTVNFTSSPAEGTSAVIELPKQDNQQHENI